MTDTNKGLSASLRRLAAQGLDLLQLRLELLGTELEQEKIKAGAALLGLLMGVLLCAVALVLLCLTAVLLTPPPWRWLCALGLGLGFAAGGVWLMRSALAMLRSGQPFAASLAELRRDRAALGPVEREEAGP